VVNVCFMFRLRRHRAVIFAVDNSGRQRRRQ
jgi:hypothetical protein